MDPETPLSRTFPTPSDMPFDSPRVALSSMDQHIFPSGASPGLALRERLERRNHEKHIKRHRPAVLAASSALQNALGIRNTTAWPTPPVSNTGSTQSTTERNGFILREALSECQEYAVRVNRGSEFRDFLDDTVHGLSQRKAKVGGPQNTGSHGVDARKFSLPSTCTYWRRIKSSMACLSSICCKDMLTGSDLRLKT